MKTTFSFLSLALLAVATAIPRQAIAEWIGGATSFKAGEICLVNMDENDLREAGDHFIGNETWTKFEFHVGGAFRTSSARLYVLDGPPKAEDLGPGFHDCADYAAKSKRVLLDADISRMTGHGFARRAAGNRPFAVDIRELRADLEKVHMDIGGVFGGTLRTQGGRLSVRNDGQVIGSQDSVTGTLRISATNRPILGARVIVEATEHVVDLSPKGTGAAEFDLDLGSGIVRMREGHYQSEKFTSTEPQVTFSSFAFRDVTSYSLDALWVRASSANLTAGAAGVRIRHGAIDVVPQPGLGFGAGSTAIARAAGKAIANPTNLTVSELTLTDMKTSADAVRASNGSLPGDISLQFASWGPTVAGTLDIVKARSDRLAFLLGTDTLPNMRFAIGGDPARLSVTGALDAMPAALGPIQFAGVTAAVKLPAFTIAAGIIEIPFRIDHALDKGTVTLRDGNKEVTLEGQLRRLLLTGTLVLGTSTADAKVKIPSGGLIFDLAAAVAVKPIIGGSKPEFARAELRLESIADVVASTSGATGAIRASAAAAVLANPVISLGGTGPGHELQGRLESTASVAIDMDLATSKWKMHRAALRASNIAASPLAGTRLVVGDISFQDPRLSLSEIRMDFADGIGTVRLSGLSFAAQGIEHRTTDPARPGPYWATVLAEPFTVERISAGITSKPDGGLELTKPELVGLKLAPTNLVFESADGSSRFESTAGARLELRLVSDERLDGSFGLGEGSLALRGATSGGVALDGVEFELSGSKAAPAGQGRARIRSMDVRFSVPHDPVSLWTTHCPASNKPKLEAHVVSVTPSELQFVTDGGGFKGTATLGLTSASVWLPNPPFQCEWSGAESVDITWACAPDWLGGGCWKDHWSFHYAARLVLAAASLSIVSHNATIDVASGAHQESNKRACLGTFAPTSPFIYAPVVTGWLTSDIGGVLGDLIRAAQELVSGIVTGITNLVGVIVANSALFMASITSPVSGKTLCF